MRKRELSSQLYTLSASAFSQPVWLSSGARQSPLQHVTTTSAGSLHYPPLLKNAALSVLFIAESSVSSSYSLIPFSQALSQRRSAIGGPGSVGYFRQQARSKQGEYIKLDARQYLGSSLAPSQLARYKSFLQYSLLTRINSTCGFTLLL